MARRRMMKSALRGFLGTYTSRNADLGGYWIHGQLPLDRGAIGFDLLGPAAPPDQALAPAWRLARRRFVEQVRKAGLDTGVVRDATLLIEPGVRSVRGPHGDGLSEGHRVRFMAAVTLDTGRRYSEELHLFVAPHDPVKELRRATV